MFEVAMIIKNHKNKNQYYLSNKMWIRNFTKPSMAEDINNLTSPGDYDLLLENEMKNSSMNIASIDSEMFFCPNVIIVSDGFDFEKRQHLLKKLKNVTIIGVNKSLSKWARHTKMDWFLETNPYKECMYDLPDHTYYPRCIVSNRVNPNFVLKYRARLGVVYRYSPTPDGKFSTNYFPKARFYIDDYRNPICAAMHIAYKWEVRKLLLFCCDDSFEGERPGAIKLNNGLYMYEQHKKPHSLIEGIAYWMKNKGIKIGNYSSGPEYHNVDNVDIESFF